MYISFIKAIKRIVAFSIASTVSSCENCESLSVREKERERKVFQNKCGKKKRPLGSSERVSPRALPRLHGSPTRDRLLPWFN